MARKSKYRFLWKLAGEDRQVLNNSSTGNQLRFAFSGLLIGLLFISGLISYHHTFMQLFNIPYFSWVLSVLFTLIIFNIYRLSLITIATNQSKKSSGHLISLFLRICFLVLLGLTIIKPIEALILKRTLALELAYLKVEEIRSAKSKTSAHFDEAIAASEDELKRLNEQLINGRIQIGADKLEQIEEKKSKLISDRNTLIEETEKRIDISPYFVRGLLLLNIKFPWVWYISVGFIVLFLLPLCLKFFISRSSSYASNMAELDEQIILDAYDRCKFQYPQLFQKSIGIKIELQERFEDPPFNLIPKVITRKTGDEEDFLKFLHGL